MIRRSFLLGFVSTLALGASAEPPAHERELINKLINFVESRHDTKFVRNGKEYSCDEAATFLRRKMDAMGGDIHTAHEFVERIASKSSMSGKPYHVKFDDGRSVPASRFLGDELKRLKGNAA